MTLSNIFFFFSSALRSKKGHRYRKGYTLTSKNVFLHFRRAREIIPDVYTEKKGLFYITMRSNSETLRKNEETEIVLFYEFDRTISYSEHLGIPRLD